MSDNKRPMRNRITKVKNAQQNARERRRRLEESYKRKRKGINKDCFVRARLES